MTYNKYRSVFLQCYIKLWVNWQINKYIWQSLTFTEVHNMTWMLGSTTWTKMISLILKTNVKTHWKNLATCYLDIMNIHTYMLFQKFFSFICAINISYFIKIIWFKNSKIITSLCVVIRVLFNPGQDFRYSCIHSKIILSSTSIAPGHNSNYCCLFSSFVMKC